ncbi:MAG: DNA mismatch repair protein MutL [uncultured Thermomicrobiales bacterium]|uniref:DNA mismatch repair protein MutL n=1 Tax=uncultured Thermomicrobiales bacterium TaxID=1645740 RepID=A0A6J4UEJ3_9BACT|nr:MAG: DNA mismatch repair protein MutL [uncultured Thermomicrobiales bacterium]
MPIRLLDERVIGKIAAGEVIERPASALKELVENSLDAGATTISVAIQKGGSGLIEVVDDGAGIPAAELPLALQRHATSKLTEWDDLHRLASLGFRGEALPSIAAVSDFSVRSRTADASVGTELDVVYGVARPPRPVAAVTGTRVTVRDLFGNVPARRRFLRQAGTETAIMVRNIAAYALARPDVAFSVTVDDRRSFATDGRGDEVAAAVAIWGTEVGPAAIRLPELDESAAVPGVTATGWIGLPEVTRSHRNSLLFFVNGRWVQNRPLLFALEEAYHSLVMVGRHPVGVIRIALDPAMVDVNVHPTKAEVKFVDERSVARAVSRAAHRALSTARPNEVPEVHLGDTTLREPGMENRPISLRPSTPGQRAWGASPLGDGTGFGPRPFEPKDGAVTGLPVPAVRSGATVVPEPEADPAVPARPVPVLRVLGQVNGTYIIAEGPDGMFMIDQHAAHERVMYERILSEMQGRRIDRQPFLDPMIVELTHQQYGAFERSTAELEAIGFQIDPFGPQTVAIRAMPAMMRGVNIGERLRLILDELAEGGTGESWLDAVAISAACHTSIRAGQALSLAEMRELVAQLEQTEQPRACGHGRPTMLHLSQGELEKQFARR